MRNLFVPFFIILLIIQSCSLDKQSASNNQYPSSENPNELAERKMVYEASMEVRIKSPDSAQIAVNTTVNKYEGYILYQDGIVTTFRVKNENLDAAMDEIATIGKVLDRTKKGNDVTDQYFDLTIRLENAEKTRKRYLELLSQANTISETFKVEKELERLSQTIDQLKGKINRLDHLSVYSTVTVKLKEKQKPGIIGYAGLAVYKSVKWLFVRG